MERFAKTHFKGYDRDLLSAIPPDPYCNRFNKFMKDHIFSKGKNSEKSPTTPQLGSGKLPNNRSSESINSEV